MHLSFYLLTFLLFAQDIIISISQCSSWKKYWSKKPTKPCLFLTKHWFKVWQICKSGKVILLCKNIENGKARIWYNKHSSKQTETTAKPLRIYSKLNLFFKMKPKEKKNSFVFLSITVFVKFTVWGFLLKRPLKKLDCVFEKERERKES